METLSRAEEGACFTNMESLNPLRAPGVVTGAALI
jgi:hypothetical protein